MLVKILRKARSLSPTSDLCAVPLKRTPDVLTVARRLLRERMRMAILLVKCPRRSSWFGLVWRLVTSVVTALWLRLAKTPTHPLVLLLDIPS